MLGMRLVISLKDKIQAYSNQTIFDNADGSYNFGGHCQLHGHMPFQLSISIISIFFETEKFVCDHSSFGPITTFYFYNNTKYETTRMTNPV